MAHSFLDEEPPPGYIAGLGRGATGFVTQADLGSTAHVAVAEQGQSNNDGRFDDADEESIKYKKKEEEDDEEADEFFEQIESKLHKKRTSRKKKVAESGQAKSGRVQVEVLDSAEAIKAISKDFVNEKKALSSISEDQWLNLPESGDFTRKTKRRRMELQAQQRFYRNSDTITAELRDRSTNNRTNEPGDIDITQISLARDKVLKSQLSKLANKDRQENLEDHSSVDKEEYIRQLFGKSTGANLKVNGTDVGGKFQTNTGDYARTRSLFKKLRKLEPHKAENWIASARLEASAGKMKKAREIVEHGCDKCPQNEEIWLVSLEIHSSNIPLCRALVADALQNIPGSVKLWLKAASYEESTLFQKRVLMRALEQVPHSENLWLEIVKLEADPHMKEMILKKATQLVPTSIQLWICLINVGSPKQISSVITEAEGKVNTDDIYKLWLAAAKFEEETTGNGVKVGRDVENCFGGKYSSCLDRDQWIEMACKVEKEKYGMTARAIIWNCIGIGTQKLGTEESIQLWKNDIAKARTMKNFEVVRSIYTYMTSKFKTNEILWLEYAKFELEQHHTAELYIVYEMAIENCPQASALYQEYAKSLWKIDGNVDKAENILLRGIKKNEQCEDLWLLYAKLEWLEKSPRKAGEIYEECRKKLNIPSAKLWYKQSTLERCLGNSDKAIAISQDGLKRYPKEANFYLQLSQIYEDQNDVNKARDTLNEGVKMCPSSVKLWIELADIYEHKLGRKIKARSALEEGMALNPKSDLLYLSRMKLEGSGSKTAEMILSKGLREIPDSGYLWSEKIQTAKLQHRKNFYSSALNSTKDNPVVILTIARDLWKRGKLSKAKQFFDACIDKDPDYGDGYIYYTCFLRDHGTVDEVSILEKKFVDNNPSRGLLWCKVVKDIKNWDKKPVEMLRNVADKVSREKYVL